jgi:hypothetical protein
MTPTEGTYTWEAGKITAWKENDDYRQFFEAMDVPESRIYGECRGGIHDGDYDDNGGIPTALGHAYGEHGRGSAGQDIHELEGEGAKGFSLGPVIIRRL